MATTDPIAQFLTSVRNAKKAQHRYVDLDLSNVRVEIAALLKKHGFIENFLASKERRKIRIFLKYNASRESVIHQLKRVSSPGSRVYKGYREIPRVWNGMGIAILSTPDGIMEGEIARDKKVGGELLCTVW